MKKILGVLLLAAIFTFGFGGSALAVEFSDVPGDSWAVSSIDQAYNYGLMTGQGQNLFGYGKTITKAEFATILCNMLNWQKVSPAAASFSDVSAAGWYYTYVETALANDAIDKNSSFSPNAAITREEMAVMFVRALGLKDAAKAADSLALPFTDVSANQGYICVAYDIGMINGVSADSFAPASSANREEAAAMLSRVYEKYAAKTSFLHGFYAFNAYNQKDIAAQMDAVTYMWSNLIVDDTKGVWLNTTTPTDGNTYMVPTGYDQLVNELEGNGVVGNLGVFMTKNVSALLTSAENRQAAADAILNEVSVSYATLGRNPYAGVTIDIEGLKGAELREGFNEFLRLLRDGLTPLGKTLYVAVQPKMPGSHYDGFDYATIGQLADKVIIMAHDYQPTNLNGYEGTAWQQNAALTPIGKVYYSLRAACDPQTGVADKSKLVLAVSFAAVGWEIDGNGKLVSGTAQKPGVSTVGPQLAAGAVKGYSLQYRNPYLTYTNAEGKRIFLWYEDQQSVSEKAALARMMGIDGISLWRLGNVPNSSSYNLDVNSL